MATAAAETLYGLPLAEFTESRDALARDLRSEGRRDEASAVAALRKPVLAAWVVNRLARDERDEMRRLIDAAASIRSGRDGAEAGFRDALDRLTAAARTLLEETGRTQGDVLQQVAGTLRAGAASDPELLAAGTLTRPLEASGFGAMAGAAPRAAQPRARSAGVRGAPPRVDRKAVEAARRALAEARDEARRLERAARSAEHEAERARAAAEAAGRRVAAAEARLAELSVTPPGRRPARSGGGVRSRRTS
jgi:hypothetical protein